MSQQRLIITQGQQAVSKHPDIVLSTLLGSCVAVCLWDPISQVGGLNHILLAVQKGPPAHADSQGTNAMELLINAVIKQSGQRNRLVAKVFGGAQMVDGLLEVGAANGSFVLEYLRREEILVTGQSLGGSAARQLLFWPTSGTVKVKTVYDKVPYEAAKTLPKSGNGLELL